MSHKIYRQDYPTGVDVKIISGLQKGTIKEAYELTEHLDRYKEGDFRPMRFSVEKLHGKTGDDIDIAERIDTPCLYARSSEEKPHSLSTWNYMRIILGFVPGWQLIQVQVVGDAVGLLFRHFGEDENAWFMADLSLGLESKVVIDIESDDTHPAEKHIIYNEYIDKSLPDIFIDYYADGKKQYRSYLDGDPVGAIDVRLYELIEEA